MKRIMLAPLIYVFRCWFCYGPIVRNKSRRQGRQTARWCGQNQLHEKVL